ncbi:MAG: FKBP-type peptidyl-prolyl cis-trans isomerase [Bacteroidota bacterium]
MFTRIFNVLSIFSLFLIFSCGTDSEGYRKTEDGLRYKFIDNNSGESPKIGDLMVMHIAYSNDKDSMLFDSKLFADSFSVMLVEPTFKGGVEEGFAMMSAGDSAVFKVRADSLFEKTFKGQSPYKPKKDEWIVFNVKMVKYYSKSVADSIQIATDLRNRREEFAVLDSFLQKIDLDVEPTSSGAYLKVTSNGSGLPPEKGDTVVITYKGMLLNGYVFDSTATKPFEFVVGVTPVIQGWADCIPKLVKGDEAKFAFPSDLGYGAIDQGDIPPYSPLYFEVRIVDIKRGRKSGS